ncbi:MAG TPA: hypothetical protein VHP14_22625 [Anaerolineales bacterium]|nr:hypothetical protein [Anaerolineales bacterium]
MKTKRLSLIGLITLVLSTLASVALTNFHRPEPASTLVQAVRQATERFKNINAAESAGYGLFHGCVSGPQEGAMGIHFVNGDLVGDGEVSTSQPEALIYETKGGRMQLVGVEYVVIAEDWDANHETPPSLMGQVFNYVGAPNRYRIPAFYELHVWAWKHNPTGMFTDWNPKVSCEDYTVDVTEDTAEHSSSH